MVGLSKCAQRYVLAFSGGAGMPGRGSVFFEKTLQVEDDTEAEATNQEVNNAPQGNRMAAHRKSDRRRDDLCAGGLRKCRVLHRTRL